MFTITFSTKTRFRSGGSSSLATGLALLPFALLAGCASAAPAATPDPAPSGTVSPAIEGSAALTTFTMAQADAGEETFSGVCSECHSANEFRGDDFQYRFRRRSAWNLFTLLSETMPEDAPGSLTPDAYVSVISYILRLNGYEAGAEPLETTEAALRRLPLDSVPTSPNGN